jgi:predicted PurR-regulated permease PerM
MRSIRVRGPYHQNVVSEPSAKPGAASRAPRGRGKPRVVAPEPGEPGPDELRTSFWRWGRVLFILAAIYVVAQLLTLIGGVIGALFGVFLFVVFGGIVALVVAPLEGALRRVMPRFLSSLLSIFIAVAAVGGIVYAVGSPIAGQSHALSAAIPKLEKPFIDLQKTLAEHGVNIDLGAVGNVLGIKISSANTGAILITAASITVRLLIDALITAVVAFWLLADHERLRRGLLGILPGRWRTETDFVLNAFAVVFGGYIRGQLVLAVVVGLLAGVGSFAIGVPFPLIVGVGAGVFELIPLAGPFVGAAIGLVFALTVSPTLALETIGLFAVIHLIEGYVISPRIQAHFVKLHPLVTLLALLAGVAAGGFLGAFFAVPLASLLAVIARARIADLRATQPELFTISDSAAAARGRRRTLLAGYRTHPGAVAKRMAQRVGHLLHNT